MAMESEGMAGTKRVDRVELGPTDRMKAVNISAREFACTAAGKVQGDLDAEVAEVRGSCKVEGDVRATLLKVSGSMKVGGSVKSELVRVKGALKVLGSVTADNLRTSGATKVEGQVSSSQEIFVQGVLKCAAVNAARFTLLGVVDVDGALKAESFDAELGGRSSIQSLEAARISIRKGRSQGGRSEFVAKSIKGDEVYLENTVAEEVAGRKVSIGPGCMITHVTADDLTVHPSSKVANRN